MVQHFVHTNLSIALLLGLLTFVSGIETASEYRVRQYSYFNNSVIQQCIKEFDLGDTFKTTFYINIAAGKNQKMIKSDYVVNINSNAAINIQNNM